MWYVYWRLWTTADIAGNSSERPYTTIHIHIIVLLHRRRRRRWQQSFMLTVTAKNFCISCTLTFSFLISLPFISSYFFLSVARFYSLSFYLSFFFFPLCVCSVFNAIVYFTICFIVAFIIALRNDIVYSLCFGICCEMAHVTITFFFWSLLFQTTIFWSFLPFTVQSNETPFIISSQSFFFIFLFSFIWLKHIGRKIFSCNAIEGNGEVEKIERSLHSCESFGQTLKWTNNKNVKTNLEISK